VFGIGGAHDPPTGRRLVGCLRPGLELIVVGQVPVVETGLGRETTVSVESVEIQVK
jgi:hypothetical protein